MKTTKSVSLGFASLCAVWKYYNPESSGKLSLKSSSVEDLKNSFGESLPQLILLRAYVPLGAYCTETTLSYSLLTTRLPSLVHLYMKIYHHKEETYNIKTLFPIQDMLDF
jgi:hypothetical protein